MAKKPTRLSAAVRACRESLQLTQAELAEWTGFSTATIVRWENGMRSPPRTAQRHLFVHRVATQRPDLAGALAEGLEVDLPVATAPMSAASAPAAPQTVAADPRDVLVSVYRAAEKLEIPAGRFRAIVAELVAEWSAAKWDTDSIATALTPVARTPRPAPRTAASSR
jgi:transcriptional regulator with XRE-family HTH domain